MEELSIQLPVGAESPALARRALASMAGLDQELLQQAVLLVSELVTNSVRHGARGGIELYARDDGRLLRIEVRDSGPGFTPRPGIRSAGALEPGGWGLLLVDRIADRWGVESDGGTSVWFELGTAA
jgi:anti-sigma regulatory factor (Ser/Thr protein kinase)